MDKIYSHNHHMGKELFYKVQQHEETVWPREEKQACQQSAGNSGSPLSSLLNSEEKVQYWALQGKRVVSGWVVTGCICMGSREQGGTLKAIFFLCCRVFSVGGGAQWHFLIGFPSHPLLASAAAQQSHWHNHVCAGLPIDTSHTLHAYKIIQSNVYFALLCVCLSTLSAWRCSFHSLVIRPSYKTEAQGRHTELGDHQLCVLLVQPLILYSTYWVMLQHHCVEPKVAQSNLKNMFPLLLSFFLFNHY